MLADKSKMAAIFKPTLPRLTFYCLQPSWSSLFLLQNLGQQLEYQMSLEAQSRLAHVEEVHDERRRQQLRLDDDMEDFLDESRWIECCYRYRF